MAENLKPLRKWLILIGVVAVVAVASVLITSQTRVGGAMIRAFFYDMKPLRQTDPALISYDEQTRIKTGFEKVFGMALRPGGSVLVAGDYAVRMFAPDGQLSSEMKFADTPRCVAVDTDGTLYVGFQEHVEVLDATGARKAAWASFGTTATLTAIALTPDAVFVADAGNRIVHQCDRTGKVTAPIGRKDDARNIPGLVVPSPYLDVAPGPGGLLYVTNPGRHRIEAYTPSGDLETFWGKPSMQVQGFCGCCNPVSFAPRPTGGFVTSEKGIARVKMLDAEGKLECVVAAPDLFGEDAFGVVVRLDDQGRVYVLDNGTRTVRIFSKRKAEK
ncbi:MAG: NHL repeat-containing protein [Planctomycetota bacterium]|nr:NHL repeat-containing protein [Planctomycetota bacterium]